jgi:hypothetical protein
MFQDARAMATERTHRVANEDRVADLTIRPEKAFYIIEKAREFDVKVAPSAPDPGSNPADDASQVILEDRADDPTYQELVDALDGLNEDEAIDMVALAWLGRGDFTKEDWLDARAQARDRRETSVASYLAGIPLLADYLEEALSQLGYSGEEYELGRL